MPDDGVGGWAFVQWETVKRFLVVNNTNHIYVLGRSLGFCAGGCEGWHQKRSGSSLAMRHCFPGPDFPSVNLFNGNDNICGGGWMKSHMDFGKIMLSKALTQTIHTHSTVVGLCGGEWGLRKQAFWWRREPTRQMEEMGGRAKGKSSEVIQEKKLMSYKGSQGRGVALGAGVLLGSALEMLHLRKREIFIRSGWTGAALRSRC